MELKTKLYEYLEKLNIDNNKLYSNKLEDLLEYDCAMMISINGKIFFNEAVCPLELYYHYRQWCDKISKNEIEDFVYNTEDDAQNPVFKFIYIKDKKLWTIDSIFKKYNETELFTLEEILEMFKSFEEQLLFHVV